MWIDLLWSTVFCVVCLYVATELVELAFKLISDSRLVVFPFESMQLSSEQEAPLDDKNLSSSWEEIKSCSSYFDETPKCLLVSFD